MGRATSGGTAPAPRQVFVDDSGRRSRWAGLAGAGMTVLCAAYIGVVALGLSQTEVGPLLAVPAGGNGQVAGFPNADTVPGLLAAGGAPTTTRRPAAPVRKVGTGGAGARKAHRGHDDDEGGHRTAREVDRRLPVRGLDRLDDVHHAARRQPGGPPRRPRPRRAPHGRARRPRRRTSRRRSPAAPGRPECPEASPHPHRSRRPAHVPADSRGRSGCSSSRCSGCSSACWSRTG